LAPRIGFKVVPKMPGANVTRFVPPAASTRNHWPFASPDRLSPARPTKPLGASW
jgi:hypothetical protein